jgi:putative FmdB family regulatory protein
LPLYEYRCTACGYSFEKIQNFSAKPETECPKCQGELIRPVTAPALRFEGAGWYVNDYAGKGAAKKAEGGDAPAASGSDASTGKDSKSESKPDSSTGSSETKSTPAAPAAPAPSTSSSSSSAPASSS